MAKRHVNISGVIADRPPLAAMDVETARQVAYEILDICESVDPTDDESEWERYAGQQEREMADEHVRLVEGRQAARRQRAKVDDQAWRSEAMRMGLAIREPSPHCVQAMRGGKVFAEWWPSRGTTMHQQRRGPRCADSAAFLRWLRTLVA